MDATTISMLIGFLAVIGSQIRQTALMNKRLDDMNRRLDESNRDTNKRLDEVNRRIDESNRDTNRRFDDVNARLDKQTEQLGELRERMAKLEGALEVVLHGNRNQNAA